MLVALVLEVFLNLNYKNNAHRNFLCVLYPCCWQIIVVNLVICASA